jgi:hypothetical protein
VRIHSRFRLLTMCGVLIRESVLGSTEAQLASRAQQIGAVYASPETDLLSPRRQLGLGTAQDALPDEDPALRAQSERSMFILILFSRLTRSSRRS